MRTLRIIGESWHDKRNCKLAVQTSSKKVRRTEHRRTPSVRPMTAFPEFAIPADIALTETKSPGVQLCRGSGRGP
jgi:hypothetical protein